MKALLKWLIGATVERKREPGQSCESCCHFIDHRDPTDDPNEVDGYCGELVDRLGMQEGPKINPYGGYWTHHSWWCSAWEGDSPIWGTSEPIEQEGGRDA